MILALVLMAQITITCDSVHPCVGAGCKPGEVVSARADGSGWRCQQTYEGYRCDLDIDHPAMCAKLPPADAPKEPR